MPRGIPKNKKTPAPKVGKRKYTKKVSKQEPMVQMEPSTTKTVKEEIIDLLTQRHVRFTDQDGHIAIDNSQMIDAITMEDLIGCGIQAMNARTSAKGPYIAVYY